jgi:hypothetical protein
VHYDCAGRKPRCYRRYKKVNKSPTVAAASATRRCGLAFTADTGSAGESSFLSSPLSELSFGQTNSQTRKQNGRLARRAIIGTQKLDRFGINFPQSATGVGQAGVEPFGCRRQVEYVLEFGCRRIGQLEHKGNRILLARRHHAQLSATGRSDHDRFGSTAIAVINKNTRPPSRTRFKTCACWSKQWPTWMPPMPKRSRRSTNHR